MALLNVAIDRVTVWYGMTVTVTSGDKEFRVRDDGWKLWIYRTDPDRGDVVVDYVSFGSESERTPDRESALRELTMWAQKRYED